MTRERSPPIKDRSSIAAQRYIAAPSQRPVTTYHCIRNSAGVMIDEEDAHA
jgi:hypothetical protein